MTAPVQPTLDGTMPARQQPKQKPKTAVSRPRIEDYETWADIVRPVFERVARTGRRWTSYEIAEEHRLPEPPNSQAHWGIFIGSLRDAGLIEKCGWADSERPGDNQSGVKVWRGTRAARTGRAA